MYLELILNSGFAERIECHAKHRRLDEPRMSTDGSLGRGGLLERLY